MTTISTLFILELSQAHCIKIKNINLGKKYLRLQHNNIMLLKM